MRYLRGIISIGNRSSLLFTTAPKVQGENVLLIQSNVKLGEMKSGNLLVK